MDSSKFGLAFALKAIVLEYNSSSCDFICVWHIPPATFDLAAASPQLLIVLVSVVVGKTVQDVESLIVIAIGERGCRVVNSIDNLVLV